MEKGIAVVTQPDMRWGRRDIKTTQLLPNLLAKSAAKAQGRVRSLAGGRGRLCHRRRRRPMPGSWTTRATSSPATSANAILPG